MSSAEESTGLPIEVLDRGGGVAKESRSRRLVTGLDRVAVNVRPQLFAYQFLYRARSDPIAGRVAEARFRHEHAWRVRVAEAGSP